MTSTTNDLRHLTFLKTVENELIASVEKMRAFGKPEVTGALFEQGLRGIINDALPVGLVAIPGIIVRKSNNHSSHFDCLIVDDRYPKLGRIGENVFAMAESVLAAIEFSVRLDARKLSQINDKAQEIENINQDWNTRTDLEGIAFRALATDGLTTSSRIRKMLDERIAMDLHVLRQKHKSYHFYIEWGEPYDPTIMMMQTDSGLADFLLGLIQDCVYKLDIRNRTLNDVGRDMNSVINWGTARFDFKAWAKRRGSGSNVDDEELDLAGNGLPCCP